MQLASAVSLARAMSFGGPTGWVTCKRVNGKPGSQFDWYLVLTRVSIRYCNMDYIFMMSIIQVFYIAMIVASYDIACQFFVHFFVRILGLPEPLQKPIPKIKAMVPKAHLVGHGSRCQIKFSFNWTAGMGRTCGEGIERDWSGLGKAAGSTKEMTPSGRHETLDDCCGYHNWRKVIGLGKLLIHLMR